MSHSDFVFWFVPYDISLLCNCGLICTRTCASMGVSVQCCCCCRRSRLNENLEINKTKRSRDDRARQEQKGRTRGVGTLIRCRLHLAPLSTPSHWRLPWYVIDCLQAKILFSTIICHWQPFYPSLPGWYLSTARIHKKEKKKICGNQFSLRCKSGPRIEKMF